MRRIKWTRRNLHAMVSTEIKQLRMIYSYQCLFLLKVNGYSPGGTWLLCNVASTSMQRRDVASTLMRRCFYVARQLGVSRVTAKVFKGGNFCDFLLVFSTQQGLLNRVYSKTKINVSNGNKFIYLRTFSEGSKKKKKNLMTLYPLKGTRYKLVESFSDFKFAILHT